ncbi:MAG: hypothetical protein GXX09_10255 [Syntrophomonadaceae bacterium]|nr:hypothetical protein [Syntrophomonadaceae bacterium]
MFRRNLDGSRKPAWKYEYLAVPIAFINGLFFGGYILRKMRQYWERGPMD